MKMTTILIAEDYEPTRSAIAEGLRTRGYAVVEAGDGAEGVRLTQQHHPDLVLLDLRMPVLDGWSAAKELQENPATASIPRVAITVLDLDRHALDKLAVDFALVLHKPLTLRDLSVTIGGLIHGHA